MLINEPPQLSWKLNQGEEIRKTKIYQIFFVPICQRRKRFYWTVEYVISIVLLLRLYMVVGANTIKLYGGLRYGALLEALVRLAKEKLYSLSILRRLIMFLPLLKEQCL